VTKRTSVLLLLAASTAAAAQTVDPSVDQISSRSANVELGMNRPDDPRSTAALEQLATEGESTPAEPQVTPERRSAPTPEQLSKGGKTAQAPQPLSKPSDGRQSAVERVAGADQCDPADPKRSRAKCAKVIENRAAEFARSNPNELSPEQRILLEQDLRESTLDQQRAVRKLATTGRVDDASFEAMGVAAVALRPAEEAPKKPEAKEDVARAAEIVGAILNAPRTPPQ
jgi:hypothetical protein